MNRIEVSLDRENNLIVKLLAEQKSVYNNAVLRGEEAKTFIKEMSKHPIKNIFENSRQNYAFLEYSNFEVSINNYLNLFYTKDFHPLLKKIQTTYERKSLEKKKHKKKKVTRKNKHSGKNILVAGMTFLVLATCAHAHINLIKKEKALKDFMPESSKNKSSYVFNDLDFTSSKTIKDIKLDSSEEVKEENPMQNMIQDNQVETTSIENPMQDITLDNQVETINIGNEIQSINYGDSEDVQNVSNVESISIDYSDRSETEKANFTKTSYSELINKYSKMYGLDPKLVTAIATQERGVHSTTMDSGGATGLMQIQNSVWVGNNLTAYNFDTNSNETVTVDSNNISNLETNIKMGCMILQNTLQYMDYNILAAVQCYNMGYGNMQKILKEYAAENNKNVSSVLKDTNDSGWLSNRDLIQVGDQNYVENVLSWIGPEANINVIKPDGTPVSLSVNNQTTIAKVNK